MVRRDWTAARAKVDSEGQCRICGSSGRVEAAHIIPRSLNGSKANMEPDGIVPLCRRCHELTDAGQIPLSPHLSTNEQAHAVMMAGSIIHAIRAMDGRSAVADMVGDAA